MINYYTYFSEVVLSVATPPLLSAKEMDIHVLIPKNSNGLLLDWHTLCPFQILIHIGALSDKAGFKFAENAGRGGPLGELVQWSDLIASLFALGYNLDFSTEIGQLKHFLVVNTEGGCPSVSETKYSAIFIDIVGLKHLKKITRNRFSVYK